MEPESVGTAIARVIQFSVAPVFLLSGIGAMLTVMTNRLGRVVDRARGIEAQHRDAEAAAPAEVSRQLATLSSRATMINWAIALCTVTALLVCALVATLFLGAFFEFHSAVPVAVLFVGAMSTFFVALVCFLREVFLATASLRIGLGK